MIGAEEENVLIRVGGCALTILPKLGGKIASIRMNEHELLQAPLAPYGPRTRTMSFDAGDASGWDECLPSVAGCTVQTVNGPADVPDHGDILYASLHPSPGVSVQASVDLRSSCSPAEDQGKLGSCTANAFVGVREWCN